MDHPRPATAEDIVRIVEDHLPTFKAVCANPDADTVILQQGAFGNSDQELLLLACAVKYAGLKGKHLTIVA